MKCIRFLVVLKKYCAKFAFCVIKFVFCNMFETSDHKESPWMMWYNNSIALETAGQGTPTRGGPKGKKQAFLAKGPAMNLGLNSIWLRGLAEVTYAFLLLFS